MRSTSILASILTASALVVLSAGPALASCAPPPPIEEALATAKFVFVGTVTGLDYEGRVARFEVREVWAGSVPAEVVVNGGPSLAELAQARAQGQSLATSVDRSFLAGVEYLVVSHGSDGDVLADNGCSATQEFNEALAIHRPDTAHAPEPLPSGTTIVDPGEEPPAASTFPWTAVGIALVGGGALAGGLLVRRRSSQQA